MAINVNPFQHQPQHLNGVVQGIPRTGNQPHVIPTAGSVLRGTNVGGNIVTRTVNGLAARFLGRI